MRPLTTRSKGFHQYIEWLSSEKAHGGRDAEAFDKTELRYNPRFMSTLLSLVKVLLWTFVISLVVWFYH